MPRFHVVERLGPSQSLTREGYLILHDVPLARTGPQLYSENEVPIKGDARGRVLVDRNEDEVFRPETIASLNGKAVTLDHPDEDVTPQNHRELAVGHVMHPRRGEGAMDNLLLGDLLIWAPEAIEAIRKRQMRELSVGYDAHYTDDGNGRGHQHNIIANHLALVDSGRCGPVCRIGDKATFSRDACTCGANTSDERVSKQDADYVDQASDPSERCGVCRHYQRDGTCDVVEGVINPDGWSRFFEMRAAATTDQEKPSRLTVELSAVENLRRLVAFWRYIKHAAAVGHSFSIEADRGEHLPEFWPFAGHPQVYIDGDGEDRIGKIELDGEDVSQLPDDDGDGDTTDSKTRDTGTRGVARKQRHIHIHL